MITNNKKIIKKILFEGTHQISAVLPRPLSPERSLDTFVYRIPVILNKNTFIRNNLNDPIDSFKVIFYKNKSFTDDFNSNFYNGTLDFKKFNETSETDNSNIFNSITKNITKGFYQDGNLANQHYDINFTKSNISDEDLYIYNISLTNLASKEILEENYTCMRIFSIKDNSVVDDTGFIFFESENFLRNVYETKLVYDLQYFIDQVYLEDFANSLSMIIPPLSGPGLEQIKIIKSTQFDTSITSGDITINIDFQGSNPVDTVRDEMSISGFINNSIIQVSNISFFENIVKLYLFGLDIFVFKIQCVFSINSNSSQGVQRVFEKQLAFSRSDRFIINILNAYKNQYLVSLYDRCNFKISATSKNNYIEVLLSTENSIEERDLLSLYKIESIKNNSKAYNDGELYSSSELSINDKINFINLNLDELTYNKDKTFKFFIPHNHTNIFSKIAIRIKSISDRFSTKILETDVFVNNTDYENLFNKLNKHIVNSINIDSSGINQSLSTGDFLTSYNSIKINNLQRRFGDIAYNFGYFNQQSSQNTSTTSDILDFFKSSVFCFELEESIQNIKNANFKKKKYFFGNQIIENSEVENDTIEFKRSFIYSFLKIEIKDLLSNTVLNKDSSINTIKALNSFEEENEENKRIDVDIIDFIKNNNFNILKSIKIKVIPIQKLLKTYYSQTDLDENLNIIFPEDVSNDIKNYINLSFVDLFYDKNSSLNWDKFLRFKKLYFKKNIDSNESIDIASYLSSLWDYLSSEIYINKENIFHKRESFSKADLEKSIAYKDPDIDENTSYTESDYYKNIILIKPLLTKSYFEDFNNKYFNFQINDSNFIKIDNTGMILNFRDFDEEVNKPKTLELVNTNLNKEKRIDFNLTGLKRFFSISDILKMQFFVKMSIHPLLRNINYSSQNNISLTDFINTSLENSRKIYLTQNNNYMTGNLSKYFFEYNNPPNKLNSVLYEEGDDIKLSLYIGNNSKNITSLTFKKLLDYAKNTSSIFLHDFFVRIGFSFRINNNFYYANIYKKIDRNNLNNTLVDISKVERIIEI